MQARRGLPGPPGAGVSLVPGLLFCLSCPLLRGAAGRPCTNECRAGRHRSGRHYNPIRVLSQPLRIFHKYGLSDLRILQSCNCDNSRDYHLAMRAKIYAAGSERITPFDIGIFRKREIISILIFSGFPRRYQARQSRAVVEEQCANLATRTTTY